MVPMASKIATGVSEGLATRQALKLEICQNDGGYGPEVIASGTITHVQVVTMSFIILTYGSTIVCCRAKKSRVSNYRLSKHSADDSREVCKEVDLLCLHNSEPQVALFEGGPRQSGLSGRHSNLCFAGGNTSLVSLLGKVLHDRVKQTPIRRVVKARIAARSWKGTRVDMGRFLSEASTNLHSSNSEKKGGNAVIAVLAVIATLAVSALIVALLYYLYMRRKVKKKCQSQRFISESFARPVPKSDLIELSDAQVFAYKQLQVATNDFNEVNVIGRGGFGSVFRGVLAGGRMVAVKQLDQSSKQGDYEFRCEVDMLSKLHSPYLLRLIGYCADQDHRLLVYDYMSNGSLQEHLYTKGAPGSPPFLDWETRMRVALDSARGLEYLHELVSPPVIHRDFKSSNILLDENFNARVSDFGLAKLGSDKIGGLVSTRVLGTHGYVAPEYAMTGHLTTKSDVYSYGVVLLELLTGRVPVDMKRPSGQGVLVTWALPRLTDRKRLSEMVDPVLDGQYAMKELIQVAAIAAMCVQPEADYRPLMTDVVQSLIPLVKSNNKQGVKVVATTDLQHQVVTLHSSSIDSSSSGAGNS
ncbi:hypothetical protein GOP47_0017426 [Adiantum capillus-veneris]|uniref:non-specific serine/threonine protein kinase n=1 Tax=Adiantum capillus-veneris TaxID=13818 RepID=A0A9D4UFA3_ADICA|nr:hypothetical protein GOP47_0017426 [Adiantum capillus-veneris]